MARLKDWLPVTRLDLRFIWTYVLGQTDQITKLGERIEQLEDNARKGNNSSD